MVNIRFSPMLVVSVPFTGPVLDGMCLYAVHRLSQIATLPDSHLKRTVCSSKELMLHSRSSIKLSVCCLAISTCGLGEFDEPDSFLFSSGNVVTAPGM